MVKKKVKTKKVKKVEKKKPEPLKEISTLQLKTEDDIAMDFAVKVYQKFNKIVKSIILFGSTIKQNATPGSDIDIMIIIDDASIKWDQELIAWYREELEKIVQANPYKKELHINTMKLTTWWEDLIRGDPTVLNILRYGEAMIDGGGFFNPIKQLLIQGKIKYRNGSKGLLTALEASEPVIWSNLIYPHTSHPNVPFQVLGPAYFFKTSLPAEIGGWSPFTTSEDVDFGFKAWSLGKQLALLDVYTSELGVETIGSWFKQRRRWARGHQKAITSEYLSGNTKFATLKNRLNFWTYSLNSQLMSIISIIGVPSGIYQLILTITGNAPNLGLIMITITIFNLLHWVYGSYYLINSTNKVYIFNSKREKLLFYARVNPIATLFYSMLWFIPVVLAISDVIRRRRIEWEHTPREGELEFLPARPERVPKSLTREPEE